MMNETGPYTQDVFVADFTDYNNNHPETPAPYAGVVITSEENDIIPSFRLTDKNRHPFMAVNFEENPTVFTRDICSYDHDLIHEWSVLIKHL